MKTDLEGLRENQAVWKLGKLGGVKRSWPMQRSSGIKMMSRMMIVKKKEQQRGRKESQDTLFNCGIQHPRDKNKLKLKFNKILSKNDRKEISRPNFTYENSLHNGRCTQESSTCSQIKTKASLITSSNAGHSK